MHIRDVMRIAAFMPAYRSGLGSGVEVFFRDGTTGWVEMRLTTFIARLAAAFAVDVRESRRKFGPVVKQKNLVPLVLAPLFIYVPVKLRKPLVSGDPAYGYFRLRSILEVSPQPEPATIRLEGGQEITVLQSMRTVHHRLRKTHSLEASIFEQYCLTMGDASHNYLNYFTISPYRQENSGIYGIITENMKEEVGGMQIELRNLMEELVFQRLDEILASEQSDVCRCESCRMDIAAVALNELPSRYVVTQRGATYSKAEVLQIQRYVDVVAAVNKAVNLVRKNPRHEPNN